MDAMASSKRTSLVKTPETSHGQLHMLLNNSESLHIQTSNLLKRWPQTNPDFVCNISAEACGVFFSSDKAHKTGKDPTFLGQRCRLCTEPHDDPEQGTCPKAWGAALRLLSESFFCSDAPKGLARLLELIQARPCVARAVFVCAGFGFGLTVCSSKRGA